MGSRDIRHDWTLGSAGKPEAEPGSRDWAIYTRARLHELLDERESSIEHLSYAYDAMRKHEGWRHLFAQTKQPFTTFEQFCVEKKPWGLGYDRAVVEGIIQERKTAQQQAQSLKRGIGEHGGDRKSEHVNQDRSSTLIGNKRDNEYYTARIKRERPDVYERMLRGEYQNVHRAAIDAGIKQELTTVAKMQKLWLKMTPEEKEQFQTWAIEQL